MTAQTPHRQRRQLVRVGAPILLGSVVLGIVMGALWAVLAPRTQLSVKGGAVVYAQVTEAAIGADLVFALLGIGCGAIVATAVTLRWRTAGGEVAVWSAVAGVLGSVLAWRIGLALIGGSSDTGTISAVGHPEGVTFEGPLKLDSPGALGMWSLTVLLVLIVVFWRRGRAAARRIDALIDRNEQLRVSTQA